MSMFENREFTIDQRLLSVRNTYVVKDRNGEQLGFIKQEFISLGPRFWFEDNNGVHLGVIDGKVITVHHEYEIKDKDGQLKARIKKKILKLFGSEWWMEDSEGHEIARIKGNVVHHTYDIVAPDDAIIAAVHLKWAAISDEYCIEMVKQDFDPMLVLSYAVAMDNVEHSERSTVTSGTKILGKLFGR
jgi:uncharacterized protein YxjI